MKHTTLFVAFGASLMLAGCASDKIKLEPNSTYTVEWIGERPLIDNSYLTITLDEDGRAFGTSGCNHFTGGFTLDGAALRFGPVAGTRMACAPPAMAQDQHLHAAFDRVRGWRTDGTALLLTDEGGAALLRLEPKP